MPYITTEEDVLLQRSKEYVKRIFVMRQMGTFLCFISFAAVFSYLQYSIFLYIILAINAFIWPVFAYYYAKRAHDMVKVTNITLVVDAAFGGIWVAVMQMSPMPSLIIIAILISDRYIAGGAKILKRSIIALLSGFFIVWTILGFKVNLQFNAFMVWASIPLATIYMLSLSVVTRNLSAQLIKKNREFERIALTDPSLDIPNRRLFEQRLQATFMQAQRNNTPAHLMLLDVDHFKSINDTFGHEMGDYFLSEISTVLRRLIGPKDTPARFGGDELAVIVVDLSNDEILQLAEAIREATRKIRIKSDQQFEITISIGIASVENMNTVSEWFSLADRALYAVKRQGRDGVQLYHHFLE